MQQATTMMFGTGKGKSEETLQCRDGNTWLGTSILNLLEGGVKFSIRRPQSTFRLGCEDSIFCSKLIEIIECVYFEKTEPGLEIIPKHPVTKSLIRF